MKNLVTAASLILFSLSVHALPIAGFSDVTDNGGGSYTFTFDTLPGPDIINADGLLFSGYGLDLTVTGLAGAGTVIQDVPINGGLGVNGGPNGDNMGGGEFLNFALNQSFDLLDFKLNGLMSEDGHQDAANGAFGYSAATISLVDGASQYDGVGTDLTDSFGYLADSWVEFSDINSFKISTRPDGWHGYVESVTLRINSVPEPSLLALLSIGLLGIGFTRRKA